MALYDEIEKRCKLQGTSVAALERDLGFGKGSIGKLKNGNDVSSSRLSMIATTLGSTSSELLGEITPLPSRQYSPEKEKSQEQSSTDAHIIISEQQRTAIIVK